jgi:hypothetical protein
LQARPPAEQGEAAWGTSGQAQLECWNNGFWKNGFLFSTEAGLADPDDFIFKH